MASNFFWLVTAWFLKNKPKKKRPLVTFRQRDISPQLVAWFHHEFEVERVSISPKAKVREKPNGYRPPSWRQPALCSSAQVWLNKTKEERDGIVRDVERRRLGRSAAVSQPTPILLSRVQSLIQKHIDLFILYSLLSFDWLSNCKVNRSIWGGVALLPRPRGFSLHSLLWVKCLSLVCSVSTHRVNPV